MFSFDFEAFALVVHARRFLRKGTPAGTISGFAAECGVSRAQMFRAENKQPISCAAFLTLCRALSADPMDFLLNAEGRRVSRKTVTATPSQQSGDTAGGTPA